MSAACQAAAAPAQAAPSSVVCAACFAQPPFVYVADRKANAVSEYGAAAGGLVALSPATVGTGAGPDAVAVTPDGTSVYVANFNADTVSQYDVGADGTLAPKTPATVPAGHNPTALAVSPDGASLYVTDLDPPLGTIGGAVSQYDIGPGGRLTPKTPATAGSEHPGAIAVSPDGKSVYVTSSEESAGMFGGLVSQYDVGTGGRITPKSPPDVVTGGTPAAVAITPDGSSVYVPNSMDSDVWEYDVGATGALTPKFPALVAMGDASAVPAGFAPIGIAISPDGKSVYVTNVTDGTVSQYDVGAGGALTAKSPASVAAGGGATGIAVSRDGKTAYVTNASGNTVSQYTVGAEGALSPGAGGAPAAVAAGSEPLAIAVGPAHLGFQCAGVIVACNAHIKFVGSNTITIRATLVRAAPVGILVERIVGKRRVRVGRVPFGLKPIGRLRIRWNLGVSDHKLPPGRYLITLRMFDRHKHLIALAHPVVIMVR